MCKAKETIRTISSHLSDRQEVHWLVQRKCPGRSTFSGVARVSITWTLLPSNSNSFPNCELLLCWPAFVCGRRDLQTKYPQEMQGVFQVIRPYLSAQSVDTFHDGLPSVSLKDDLVRIYSLKLETFASLSFSLLRLVNGLKSRLTFLANRSWNRFLSWQSSFSAVNVLVLVFLLFSSTWRLFCCTIFVLQLCVCV